MARAEDEAHRPRNAEVVGIAKAADRDEFASKKAEMKSLAITVQWDDLDPARTGVDEYILEKGGMG